MYVWDWSTHSTFSHSNDDDDDYGRGCDGNGDSSGSCPKRIYYAYPERSSRRIYNAVFVNDTSNTIVAGGSFSIIKQIFTHIHTYTYTYIHTHTYIQAQLLCGFFN